MPERWDHSAEPTTHARGDPGGVSEREHRWSPYPTHGCLDKLTGSATSRTPALLGADPIFEDPVYITRALVPDRAEFDARVAAIFESNWFTNNGPLVRELQERLVAELGASFCVAFCNGTVALQAALRSLDLSGEVITTPFTFPATTHAIEWNGLTPVFCDIDPQTYNMDVGHAAELVSSQTCALLPVHVFGNPCDVEGVQALAETRGLKVVYDAAHAFGVSYKGQPIGLWGDLSVFSFHATKIFHTAEGGAVTGADPAHFERLALLRNFGIVNEEEVRGVGVNGKLSELHAAVGLAMFCPAEREGRSRKQLTSYYRQRLAEVEGLVFQRFNSETVPNHAYFTVEIDEADFGLSRDELHSALRAENIIARKYFSPLCSSNESYTHLPSARPEHLPNAQRLASRILCLPNHGGVTEEGADRIVEGLLSIQANARAVRRALSGIRT